MKREFDFSKARRGPLVPRDPKKTRVTIWLDTRLVDYLQSVVDRAGGGSWEDFINELLCQRILSDGREVPGIRSQLSKGRPERDVLATALNILDSPEQRLNSRRSHVNGRSTRRVRKSKKARGARTARLVDIEA